MNRVPTAEEIQKILGDPIGVIYDLKYIKAFQAGWHSRTHEKELIMITSIETGCKEAKQRK